MSKLELEKQRARRKAEGNATTHRYEKTINGFLMRTYRNMQSRVTGVQQLKAHLYLGLTLLERKEFYAWAKNDPDFLRLFTAWELSSYARALTPSIDRIDSSKGYEGGNIRWLTHSQNSQLGVQSRFSRQTSTTLLRRSS